MHDTALPPVDAVVVQPADHRHAFPPLPRQNAGTQKHVSIAISQFDTSLLDVLFQLSCTMTHRSCSHKYLLFTASLVDDLPSPRKLHSSGSLCRNFAFIYVAVFEVLSFQPCNYCHENTRKHAAQSYLPTCRTDVDSIEPSLGVLLILLHASLLLVPIKLVITKPRSEREKNTVHPNQPHSIFNLLSCSQWKREAWENGSWGQDEQANCLRPFLRHAPQVRKGGTVRSQVPHAGREACCVVFKLQREE